MQLLIKLSDDALVCDRRLFALQGSVATHMRCGGIFNKYFAANFLEKLTEKRENFWKSLEINKDAAMSLVFPFLPRDAMHPQY